MDTQDLSICKTAATVREANLVQQNVSVTRDSFDNKPECTKTESQLYTEPECIWTKSQLYTGLAMYTTSETNDDQAHHHRGRITSKLKREEVSLVS